MLGIMVYRVKLIGRLASEPTENNEERRPLASGSSGESYSASVESRAPEASVALFSEDIQANESQDQEVSPRETYVDL